VELTGARSVVEGAAQDLDWRDIDAGSNGGVNKGVFFKAPNRSRPVINAHVIVFANEKGGVGKSTAAFHTTIALANAGVKVMAVDLDPRQKSLTRALENREGTARRLKIALPQPRYVVLNHQTDAGLYQEISRIGTGSDFIVIDVAGHDSAIARHAISMADTLVTPVNDSFVDLDVLGQIDATNFRVKALGCFTKLVHDLAAQRARRGKLSLDWIVMQNRQRNLGAHNEQRVQDALKKIAKKAGFRLSSGLSERVIYRELFPFGLTLFDLKWLPDMARAQPVARKELEALIAGLKLPVMQEEGHLFAT
jgi:chromosome partitioning protein